MPEFIFVIFWPTIALPNLIRALHDFTFGRLFYAISPFEKISPFKKNGPSRGATTRGKIAHKQFTIKLLKQTNKVARSTAHEVESGHLSAHSTSPL